MAPTEENKLSLSKQLHIGDPLVLHEEQEPLQQTIELLTGAVTEMSADEEQLPKANKMAVKKFIASDNLKAKQAVEVLHKSY